MTGQTTRAVVPIVRVSFRRALFHILYRRGTRVDRTSRQMSSRCGGLRPRTTDGCPREIPRSIVLRILPILPRKSPASRLFRRSAPGKRTFSTLERAVFAPSPRLSVVRPCHPSRPHGHLSGSDGSFRFSLDICLIEGHQTEFFTTKNTTYIFKIS